MRSQIEQTAVDLFNENFGDDLETRIEKLKEEFSELIEAYELYKTTGKPFAFLHLQDEVSDVHAVLTHIQSIIKLDCYTSLINAIIKIKVRQFNPDYKR